MGEGLGEMGSNHYPYGAYYWDDENVLKLIVTLHIW